MRYCEIRERDCPADCNGWHMPCLDEPDPHAPRSVHGWWWLVAAAVGLALISIYL